MTTNNTTDLASDIAGRIRASKLVLLLMGIVLIYAHYVENNNRKLLNAVEVPTLKFHHALSIIRPY